MPKDKRNKGMPREYKCKHCGKFYAIPYNRDRHEQHCPKNPNRGKNYEQQP